MTIPIISFSGNDLVFKTLGIACSIFLLMFPVRAMADARVALVIGNAAYMHTEPLLNSAHDARLISRSLESIGFKVTVLIDANLMEMKRAIREFGNEINIGDVAFIYYAGHGIQHNGENYLIPTDAMLRGPDDLPQKSLPISEAFAAFPKGGKTTNIIVLDACRNNPFSNHWAYRGQGDSLDKNNYRALRYVEAPAGLSQLENIPSNTLIAFATSPGKVALDGVSGGNSPYAEALASVIMDEGVEVTEMFLEATNKVKKSTKFRQEPWVNLSLNGKVFFKARKQNRVVW